MTFGVAVILLLCTLAGVAASCIGLRQRKTLRGVLIVLLCLVALALAAYIALTVFFVTAARNQPPAL